MKLSKHHYFYLFTSFLFLGIVSVNLFPDGMFMDGLLYADISRNMAEGLGSFWKPHLTQTMFNEFYEHPPLALGLQSLGFTLFGDSIYVERFYSLITAILVGCLIVLIWNKLTNDKKTGWLPMFLWVIVNEVTWGISNNMLENTMSVFVCMSFLFYLNSFSNKRIFWIILSGLSLSLGLLTKGFFCLYIWGVPFFIWFFRKERSFWQMVSDTFILFICTLLPIAILYLFVPEAQHNMFSYFNKQVVGSIQNVKTVSTRFAIVFSFLNNIIIPLIISGLILLISFKKKSKKEVYTKNIKDFLMFLAITLSGILPIMISMKQRGFYILTVYPLFAIGLAHYLYPIITPIIKAIKIESKGFKAFKIITIIIILISISLSVSQINKAGRDKEMISEVKQVIQEIGKNTTINICKNMHSMWNLHGYFSRYGNVSLDKNSKNEREYYLTLNKCDENLLQQNNYELIKINTHKYKLYKKK